MEPVNDGLGKLFLMFAEVYKFCEGLYITVDSEVLFRSAELLETTYSKLESIESLGDFQQKLNKYFTSQSLKVIPIVYFKDISHKVLAKFITDSRFNNDQVRSALINFRHFKSEKGFAVIKQLFDTNRCVQLIKQRNRNLSFYNASLRLEELSKYPSPDGISDTFNSLAISEIRGSGNFEYFLKLLCKTNGNVHRPNCIQELTKVIATLLQDPDHVQLYQFVLHLSDEECCNIAVPLFNSFMKIIEYSFTKLKCTYSGNSYSWVNTENEMCLSFQDISILVSKLKTEPDIFKRLNEALNKLKHEGYQLIVEDLLRDCSVK